MLLLIKSDAQLCLKSCIIICLTFVNLRLLEKEAECNLKEEQETTIILSLILILENHIINNSEEVKDYKVELQNKEILRNLNQLFNIRENYENRLNMR